MAPCSQSSPPRFSQDAVPQNKTVAEVPCPHMRVGAGPASGAHRHSGADPRNPQRARRVALTCEVVSEHHITRSKTARGAVADPDSICPARIKMYCRRGPIARGALSSHKNPSRAHARESPTPPDRAPDRIGHRFTRGPPSPAGSPGPAPIPGPSAHPAGTGGRGPFPPAGGSWDPIARGSLKVINACFLKGLEKTTRRTSPPNADFSTG